MNEGMHVVELIGLPVGVHDRARDHHQTLLRELALIDVAGDLGTASARLRRLSSTLREQYAAFSEAPEALIDQAIAGEGGRLDLRYAVPAHAADAAEELASTWEEVETLCRSGGLVTLVASPETIAYRRWILAEFLAQIRDGATPTPWRHHDEDETPAVPAPAETAVSNNAVRLVVEEDLDLEGTARVRSRIARLIEGGARHVVVDLAGCGFIDSVGLSLLLTTRERLHGSAGSLVVTNVTSSVRRTLDTAGVHGVLAGDG
jgi:anti-anti-sigma factor